MVVPGFQDLMLPFLQICKHGQERTVSQIGEIIAKQMGLTEQDLQEVLESGQTKFYNRTAWVKTYFGKAGLLDFPSRGKFKITPRGLELLAQSPNDIRVKTLTQYPEFQKFHRKEGASQEKGPSAPAEPEAVAETVTPEERLENASNELQAQLASELLEAVTKNPPLFFEQLVIDLLVTIRYGWSRLDAGQTLGKTGDGGIDGIIKEDKLGLDVIYLQAKRYVVDNVVPSRDIRDFTGSLDLDYFDKS